MRSTFKSARSPRSSAGAFESERRELARRSSAGVDVTLYWHPTLDELILSVWDERHDAYRSPAPAAAPGLPVTATVPRWPAAPAEFSIRTHAKARSTPQVPDE